MERETTQAPKMLVMRYHAILAREAVERAAQHIERGLQIIAAELVAGGAR